MSKDDWYRNENWNADIEAAFRTKLARSRTSRPQYLSIQAGYLAERHPLVSLALIEEYFATDDEFEVPTALCTQAAAHLALGNVSEAVAAYKRALELEEYQPNYISTARLDLPTLVAGHRIAHEYHFALAILADRFKASDLQFPSHRYYWNGANALIAYEIGNTVEARDFAERALLAAAKTESPFRYHRTIGLVGETEDDFGNRLKRIAKPSKLRSWLRVVSGKK